MMYRQMILALTVLLGMQMWAQPVGWAAVDGITDGGRGENPVTVRTFDELKKAFGKRDTVRRTIFIEGRIEVPGILRIKDVSNKSLIGKPGSCLVNDKYTIAKDSTGILLFERCNNIIVQNITFLGPGAFDRDANDNLAVAQCDHCWWDEGCRMRMPFARFGKIHLLNCLYSSSVAVTYIQARYQSNVLVEACAFVNKPKKVKVFQIPDQRKPEFADYNIRFRHCLGADDIEQRNGDAPYFEPQYKYCSQPADKVEADVKAGAGASL